MTKVPLGRKGFMVLYALEGGYLGGTHQMLLITTDPATAKETQSNGIVSDDNFACWEERYVVSAKTARGVEDLLTVAEYDKFPSFQGNVDTDMYRWKVTVSRGNDVTSIQVFDSPGVFERFVQGPRRRAMSVDNEEVRCATVLFDLVEECRRLAQTEGRRVQ